MADLGVDDIAVVGVAKGPDRDAGLERFFMPGKTPFMLEPKSPVLYYLQRLRDEAHRFAIGTHRTRRAMEMRRNPLDEIEGVGAGAQAGAAARLRLGPRRLPRLGRRPRQGRRRQRGAGPADLRLLPEGLRSAPEAGWVIHPMPRLATPD